jgi:hypothetical protein
MNAKEAKTTATKRAEELKKQREEAEQRRQEKAAKEWKEERANFLKNRIAWLESDIKEAVDKGKTKITMQLESHEEAERSGEKWFWQVTPFKPEWKKIFAHFEDLGYELKITVKRERHYDLSDLNPRDDWYTSDTILEVSW